MRTAFKISVCFLALAGLLLPLATAPAAEDQPEVASLKQRMTNLVEQARFTEAISLAEQVLALAEKTSGPQSTNAADGWKDLAEIYQVMSAHAKAEGAYQRAVAILDKDPPPDVLQTARVLAGLGSLYILMGHLNDAEPLLQRSLQIRSEKLPPDHADLGTSHSFLGWLFIRRGDYAKSETFYVKALHIRERALGLKHADTAGSLDDLALLYHAMGDYVRAESFYVRSLKIREEILPTKHPDLGRSYNNLALFYKQTAEYAKAEEMYRHALEIKERPADEEDYSLALTLNNFGTFYLGISDYAKAEPLLQRALAIKQKVLDPDHASTALTLHNLGLVYQSLGELEKAETYYLRDVAMVEKTLSTNHAETAISLHSLGTLYHDQHDLAKAETAYLLALEIRERALSSEHPDIANSLHDLARLCLEKSDAARAEALFLRALSIREKILGPHHPDTAKTLAHLARVKIDAGKRPEALKLAVRVAEAHEVVLANILSFTSEQQRLAFQQRADPYSLAGTLGDAQLAVTALLHNKGIVLDSLLEDRLIAASATDAKTRELSEQLRLTKQLLSPLLLVAPKDASSQTLQRRAAEKEKLTAQVERIEATLARQFVGLGRARRALSVSAEQVREAIPPLAALVEFVRYAHYVGTNHTEPRYGAVVLASASKPAWVALGAADAIEKNTRLFQSLMRGSADEAELERVLQSLYAQVWSPVEQVLPRGTKTVILSPDGELNFVSFAVFLNPAKRFLADAYSIRYVANGRDLLPAASKPNPSRNLVICANPDFGAGAELPAAHEPAFAPTRAAEMRGFRDLTFRPLPGAENEARALQKKSSSFGFGQVSLFVGKAATESELSRVAAPYVLHLATHGFFLPGLNSPSARGGAGLEHENESLQPRLQPNPMRRSGLALAGAQRTIAAWANGQTPAAANDGIVSAEEVGGLNLRGTWLVVVSACDTAVGEARAGEGVLGLRRGFLQAGAQNLLLTLWPIDDERTAYLVLDFYATAFRTGDAPSALAEIQRKWLNRLRAEKGLLAACRITGPLILSFQGEAR